MVRLIKELLFVSIIITTFFIAVKAYAEEERERPTDSRDFNEVKSQMLKVIDAQLTGLKKEKDCIESARDFAGIRACKEAHREEMRKLLPRRPGGERRDGMGPGGPPQLDGR